MLRSTLFIIGLLLCQPVQAQTQYQCWPGSRIFSMSNQNYTPLCVMSFTLSAGGVCDGLDNVQRWSGTGINGQPTGWRMFPWTPGDISVLGVRACQLVSGGQISSSFVGDDFSPDVTTAVNPNDPCPSDYWRTPQGTALQFPGTVNAPSDGSAYFDFHNICTGGGNPQWRIDILYAPSAYTPPPPPACSGTVVTTGTYGAASTGAGGRSLNALYANGGLEFTATVTGTLVSAVIDADAGSGVGSPIYDAQLWSSVSGSPGSLIGTGSATATIAGAQSGITFNFPTPPAIVAGTSYQLVFANAQPGGAGDWIDVDTAATQSGYGSGRNNSIPAITTNGLPNSETFRVQINQCQ